MVTQSFNCCFPLPHGYFNEQQIKVGFLVHVYS